jgi:hypothetical protein
MVEGTVPNFLAQSLVFFMLFLVFVLSRFLARKEMAKIQPVGIIRQQAD